MNKLTFYRKMDTIKQESDSFILPLTPVHMWNYGTGLFFCGFSNKFIEF